MIRLFVKGSRFVAHHAMKNRGIEAAEFKPHTSTFNLSIFYVPDEYRSEVVRWYAEPMGSKEAAPGTLLHYKEDEREGT